jgi:hypothetical protein
MTDRNEIKGAYLSVPIRLLSDGIHDSHHEYLSFRFEISKYLYLSVVDKGDAIRTKRTPYIRHQAAQHLMHMERYRHAARSVYTVRIAILLI